MCVGDHDRTQMLNLRHRITLDCFCTVSHVSAPSACLSGFPQDAYNSNLGRCQGKSSTISRHRVHELLLTTRPNRSYPQCLTAWRNCVPGEYVSALGTRTSDRGCARCATGKIDSVVSALSFRALDISDSIHPHCVFLHLYSASFIRFRLLRLAYCLGLQLFMIGM